jgi:anti-sigma factor RsiW
MNCSRWEEKLALHAGGDLEPADAAQIESHLRDCESCRSLFDDIRQSLAMLVGEPVDSAAIDAVRERTLSALRPARLHLWRYAAALCLMLGGMSWWAGPTTLPGPPAVTVAVPPPALPPLPTPVIVTVPAKRVRKVVEKHESVVVKLQTADPDIVIYWITG